MDAIENSKKIKTSIKRFFRKINEVSIYIKESIALNIDSISTTDNLQEYIIDIRSLIYALSQFVPNFEAEFKLLEAEKQKAILEKQVSSNIEKNIPNQFNYHYSEIENCPQVSIHEVTHLLKLKDSSTTHKWLKSVNISPHKIGSKVMIYVQELQLELDLPLALSLKSKDPKNWENTFINLSRNEKTANAIIYKLNNKEESKFQKHRQISSEYSKNKFKNI